MLGLLLTLAEKGFSWSQHTKTGLLVFMVAVLLFNGFITYQFDSMMNKLIEKIQCGQTYTVTNDATSHQQSRH
jgi:hypothetical protein